MKEEIIIITADHPEANGRKPVLGDTEYQMRFPTADGKELVVKMGQQGWDLMTNFVFDMLSERPSYGDGSTNMG